MKILLSNGYCISKDKFEKIFIFLYVLITIGLYNANYLNIVRVSYGLIVSIFLYNLIKTKKFINGDYFVISIIFLIYCFLSTFWAKSTEYALANYLFLFKYVILSIVLASFCRDSKSTYFILKSLAFAGLVYCIYNYIASENLQDILTASKRITNIDVPINVLGTIASLSVMVFLFAAFIERNRWYIILFIIGIIIIILTGSRKSIMSVFLGILIFIYASKFKYRVYTSLLIVALILAVATFADTYFTFLLSRFQDLEGFFNSSLSLSGSDSNRYIMIELGLVFFWDNPVLGNGFYNYPILFEKFGGTQSYAHNNYIETLVDLGLIGFSTYYLYFFLMIKKVNKVIGYNKQTLIITLIVVTLFSQIAIVILIDRFSWMLMPILFMGAKFFKNDLNEDRIYSK